MPRLQFITGAGCERLAADNYRTFAKYSDLLDKFKKSSSSSVTDAPSGGTAKPSVSLAEAENRWRDLESQSRDSPTTAGPRHNALRGCIAALHLSNETSLKVVGDSTKEVLLDYVDVDSWARNPRVINYDETTMLSFGNGTVDLSCWNASDEAVDSFCKYIQKTDDYNNLKEQELQTEQEPHEESLPPVTEPEVGDFELPNPCYSYSFGDDFAFKDPKGRRAYMLAWFVARVLSDNKSARAQWKKLLVSFCGSNAYIHCLNYFDDNWATDRHVYVCFDKNGESGSLVVKAMTNFERDDTTWNHSDEAVLLALKYLEHVYVKNFMNRWDEYQAGGVSPAPVTSDDCKLLGKYFDGSLNKDCVLEVYSEGRSESASAPYLYKKPLDFSNSRSEILSIAVHNFITEAKKWMTDR